MYVYVKRNIYIIFCLDNFKDIDNRRSQLMNNYIRDKTDENAVDKTKICYTDLETKQHEDQLRHLEVKQEFWCLFFSSP